MSFLLQAVKANKTTVPYVVTYTYVKGYNEELLK